MKLCSDSCKPIYDFCKHYRDNGYSSANNEFEGNGICLELNKKVECTDGIDCEEFYCFRVKIMEDIKL